VGGADERKTNTEILVTLSPEALEALDRKELIGIVLTQGSLIERQGARIAELERRLGQNSQNSSLPPSRDTQDVRTSRAERRAAQRAERSEAKTRNPGKQPGAPGKHLAQSTEPDAVIVLDPGCCGDCGGDLCGGEDLDDDEVRQVFDIPEPKLIVTEYRARRVRCRCGTTNVAAFPDSVKAPTSYGPRLKARALYLMARQHIPFDRAAEAMADLFGAEVSTGFLDHCFSEGADGLEEFVEVVRLQLIDEPVIHVDETSDRLGRGTMWFHVVCTELLTLLHADTTRGHDAVIRHGVLPDYGGIAVHDRLAQYQSYTDATHAFCGAHLVRDLTSVATIPGQAGWSTKMIDLLYEMRAAAEEARSKGKTRLPKKVLAGYLERYDNLVAWAFVVNPEQLRPKATKLDRESFNLATAFRTHKAEITRFASDLRVSFSNNQAERDLRMVKIHRKVSGGFRSMTGAERLARVRSYISTAQKHGVHPFDVLTRLFEGDPWMPQLT